MGFRVVLKLPILLSGIFTNFDPPGRPLKT
jgi:hypothetical protein